MTLYVGTREELVAPILEAKKRIPNPQGISIIVTRPGQTETTTNFDNYGDALVYLTNIEFSEDEPDFCVRLIIK